VSSDASADAPSPPAVAPCPSDEPCRILPFGDSITAGWNSKLGGGYREGLFRLLRAAHESATFVGTQLSGPDELDGVAFPRDNEGHAGWSIANAPDKNRSGVTEIVATTFPQSKPHVVLLHIGTNDIISTIDFPHMNDRLETLVDHIEQSAPKALVVVAQIIPVGGQAPFDDAGNQQVKRYNAGIRAMVERRRARGEPILTVDAWTAFASRKDYPSLAGDGWHPSDAGYDVMAKVWHDAIAPYLRVAH
jgi:lysophospholipase L1-like esterase